MNAFSKLREKLFPRSEIDISAVYREDVKSTEAVSLPASEDSLPVASERELEDERLELTPELEEALFPKTPLMISATFKPSEAKKTPREAPKENRGSSAEGEQQFPII